jgi:hypothetical protein
LTANYKIFQALVDNSGFGWNEEKKLNTAPESVWAEYIEVSDLNYNLDYSSNTIETSQSS